MGVSCMGLSRGSSKKLSGPMIGMSSGTTDLTPGNPNPFNFEIKILYESDSGQNFCAWVNYPDCTNYEGNKILVFKNNPNLKELFNLTELDPHFIEDGKFSPFARFEPTQDGWDAAVNFVVTLDENNR